jgi:hypothetical protein
MFICLAFRNIRGQQESAENHSFLNAVLVISEPDLFETSVCFTSSRRMWNFIALCYDCTDTYYDICSPGTLWPPLYYDMTTESQNSIVRIGVHF